jgi:hypothetical protein
MINPIIIKLFALFDLKSRTLFLSDCMPMKLDKILKIIFIIPTFLLFSDIFG